MHTFRCRKSLKKTLRSAQNLENKGLEIFLPPRSMVLKGVTGKIFKTLELLWSLPAGSSVLEPRGVKLDNGLLPSTRPLEAARRLGHIRLSKSSDYLIDNLYVVMLSKVRARGQGESGRVAGPVPNRESRTRSERRPRRPHLYVFL
jgi:hypothetical protein